jgi:hypothetical protein
MSLRTIASTALAIIITAAAFATASQAATITTQKDGCEPKGCYNIVVEGNIEFDDWKKFDAVIKSNDIKVATVTLNSEGGNLIGGVLIGLNIKDHGFNTFVPDNGTCASVCASIWLAGLKKFTSPSANIGFHQPYSKDKRGRVHVDAKVTAFIKSYYNSIGVSKAAADFFVAANPADIYWLNSDLAKGFGIEVTTWSRKSKQELEDEKAVAKVFGEDLISKKLL